MSENTGAINGRESSSPLCTQTSSEGEQNHSGTKEGIDSEAEAEPLGGASFSSQGWRSSAVLSTSGSTDGRKINRRGAALTSCGYKQVLRLHAQANQIISLEESLRVHWVQLPAADRAVYDKAQCPGLLSVR